MNARPMGSSGTANRAMDGAGIGCWDCVWHQAALPPPFDPERRGLNHHVTKKLHAHFQLVLRNCETRGKQLLEIVCGNSVFLPYFSNYFGFEVSGIDYSEFGYETSRRLLRRECVAGEIYRADFFEPPECLLSRFDVVVSLGVVEHFQNSIPRVTGCSRFVRSGGISITLIPNLLGLVGNLQKLLARSIYNIHVAHECATRLGSWISKSVWMTESLCPFLKPNPWTSPYVC